MENKSDSDSDEKLVARARGGDLEALDLLVRRHQSWVFYQFMNNQCGLINQTNPCRCARKASGFMRHGWLDPKNLQFSQDRIAEVRDLAAGRLEELQALDRRHAELYRMQPYLKGPDLAPRLREILSRSGFDRN